MSDKEVGNLELVPPLITEEFPVLVTETEVKDLVSMVSDEAFRDEVKALYEKHKRKGIIVLVMENGSNLFSWIGLSDGQALDQINSVRRTFLDLVKGK